MKTKFLFTMCATTLLVACTNEEFISAPENDLTDRAKVEVTLGAEMGGYSIVGDADTRTIWDNGIYKWEAGDMLGACVVDGSSKGAAAYNNITTNHPYTIIEDITDPVAMANFHTNTAVVEGIYVFYHGYRANVPSASRTIDVSFPEQTYDPKAPYAHLTKDNFFVSPLIKIVGGVPFGEDNTLPVQFTSLYSGFAPTLVNTSGKDITVSKVEFSLSSGDFKLGESLNTVTGNTMFGDVVASDDEDLAGAIETARNAMRSVTVDLYKNATKGKMISIALPDVAIANGKELEVRMLFPAGTCSQGDLTMTVYTDKGVFSTVANPDKAFVFTRDLFGTRKYEMNKFEKPENFSISNRDEWNYAVNFVKSNSYTNINVTFTLTSDVTLTDVNDAPDFPVNVKSAASEKLILDKEGATFRFLKGSFINSLEVAEGTALEVDGESRINTLKNDGAVTIPATVTGVAAVAFESWLNAKTFGVATLENNGTITIAESGTLDIATATKAAPTLSAGSEIVNNGTLIIGKANTTNGGTITNNGTLTVGAAVINTGLITNNGALEATSGGAAIITNNGEMNLGAECTVKDLAGGSGAKIIENGATGVITLADVGNVFRTSANAPASTGALIDNTTNPGAITSVAITAETDLASLPGEVNCLSISGTWTAEQAANLNKAAITNLIMAGASIEMNGAVKLENYVTKIIVKEGENTVTNESTAAMLATNADLTIEPGAKLTVGENVRFGLKSAAVATITVLGELVNSGAIAGTITVGTSGTEDADKAINAGAKITNNAAAYLTAGSGYSPSDITAAALTNYGTVVNIATGTITATKVEGTGSISGGYTTASGATVAADAVGMAD